MPEMTPWMWRLRRRQESNALPGLNQDVFCAWCGGHMPVLSLQPHMEREHAAILQANREWEWSNPL